MKNQRYYNTSFTVFLIFTIGLLWLPPLDAQPNDLTRKVKKQQVTAEEIIPDRDIIGVFRIINPYFKGKLRNDTESCKAFLRYYNTKGHFVYLTHKSKVRKGKKGRFTTEIIVLDTSRNLKILDPNDTKKLVAFLLRYLDCDRVSPIFKEAITKANSATVILDLARLACDVELRTFAYQRYFETFYQPKEVWEGLREITKPDSSIKSLAAKVAYSTINTEAALLQYFEHFRGYYHDQAFQQLANALSCSAILNLLKAKPSPTELKDIRPPNLEQIEVACITTVKDFLTYLAKYPGGPHNEEAAQKIAGYLLADCQLISFIKEQKAIAARFKGVFFDQAVECVRSVADCIRLNEVYRQEEDIQKVLNKAVSSFPLAELLKLIQAPVYNGYKEELQSVFLTSILTVSDVDIFLQNFPDVSLDTEKAVYRLGMKFAKTEQKPDRLIDYLLTFVARGGSYTEVQEFLDCSTRMKVARERPETRTDLHNAILPCVGKDSLYIMEYLDHIFPGNEEELLSGIATSLDATLAKFFFRKYGDPGGHIERHFPNKIRTEEDVEFYFDNFHESPFLKSALEKGIRFAQSSIGKYRMIKRLFDRQGYSRVDANLFLENCYEKIEFAESYGEYRDSLCLLSRECVTDLKTARLVSKVCDIPLDQLGVGKEIFETMRLALAVKPLSQTFEPSKPSVPFSVPIRDLGVIAICAKVDATKGSKNNFLLSLELQLGDTSTDIKLSHDEPIYFFKISEDSEPSASIDLVVKTIEGMKGSVSLSVINFPGILTEGNLKRQFYSEKDRKDLITVLDQLRNKNDLEKYHLALVDPENYALMKASNAVSPLELNDAIRNLAHNFIMVYDQFPKDRFNGVARKFGALKEWIYNRK